MFYWEINENSLPGFEGLTKDSYLGCKLATVVIIIFQQITVFVEFWVITTKTEFAILYNEHCTQVG